MKKLIAISVMIALIAGAVFADTAVSGAVEVRVKLYDAEMGDHGPGYDGGYPRPTAGGEFGAAHIQLSTSNDDGTLSGLFRLRNVDIVRSDPWFHRVFINWKPIPMMNIFMGIDQDGKFATDALQGWAFHQGVDDYVHFQWWDFWRACFPGNWDGFGAAVSLYPVPGVDVNVIVPFGGTGWPQATDGQVKKTSNVNDLFTSGYRVQANVSVPDIGQVKFSYKGPYNNNHFQAYSGKYQDMTFSGDTPAYGAVGVSFLMTGLVEGMQANVGFATDNIVSEYADGDKLPLYFGAGVHWAMGDFGVKFRTGVAMNHAYDEGRMFITGNIMPWYNLGFMGVYLDIGTSMDKLRLKLDGDAGYADYQSFTGFFVNPYVKVPISGGYFQAGFSVRKHINSHGNVSVPTKTNDAKDGLEYTDDYMRIDFPIVLGINF